MKTAVALIVAGLALLGISQWLLNAHTWTPLFTTIEFRPAQVVSHSFAVDLTAEYSVEIEVGRFLSFEELEKMLAALDVTYRVEDLSAKPVKEFHLIGSGSSGKNVVRVLGQFDGKKNHSYRITLESHSDGIVLTQGTPRLVVRENSHLFKGNLAMAQVLALPAFGLIGIGAIWLFFVGISRLFKKRPNRPPELRAWFRRC
jgi:hypothetical protein